MQSSPPIWHYVVSVKSSVKILSNFVAFLENINFMTMLNAHVWIFWVIVIEFLQSVECIKKLILFERKKV